MRGQILKVRKFSRPEVLNQRKRVGSNSRFVFNTTYHPVLSKLKNVLSEIQLLLTPDREHGKVFENIPIVGFRRAKSLKDVLVRAEVAPIEKKKSSCRSCGGTRCEICKHAVTTETFRSFSTKREHCIKPNNLNCRSNNVVYLFSCEACSKQYTGSTESFRSRFNNYKSAHRNYIKRNTVKQASFHAHFENDKHGMSDWEITLIDQTESVSDLRRRESFWQYELDTFQPNELNERDLALFSCVYLLNIYIVFIFSGLTHYIYCSASISTIILRVLIILLFTLTVIIINLVIVITITIFLFISFKIYLFVYLLIYLFIYLLIRGPTWLEGSPLVGFLTLGICELKE